MKCSAHNRFGNPCQRNVSPGFTVCSIHGAAAPEAIIKAQNAMAVARMPAVEALHLIIEQWMESTCAACGYPSGDSENQRVVIAAAKTVLDRAGMGPHSTVDVRSSSDADLELARWTTDEKAELAVLAAQLKDLKARVNARIFGAPDSDDEAPSATVN